MSTAAAAAKKALRKEIGDRTAKLDEAHIMKQSRCCQQAVLDSEEYQSAERLSIYLAMPSGEMQTDLIVRDALNRDKKVFVPFLYSITNSSGKPTKSKIMDMLRLNTIQEFEGLQKDSWGIPSLAAETVDAHENALGGLGLSFDSNGSNRLSDTATEGGLDLMIVPGVAFDASMARLGHGAGFYDKFLTRLSVTRPSRRPSLGKPVYACTCMSM